jgi:hypothetical protein
MKPYRDIGNFKTRGIAHKNTWYHLQKTRGIAHYVRGIAHLITWYRTPNYVVSHTKTRGMAHILLRGIAHKNYSKTQYSA